MIDSHCHLADDAFASDLEDVIGRARAAGVTSALCILSAGDATESTAAAKRPAAVAGGPVLRRYPPAQGRGLRRPARGCACHRAEGRRPRRGRGRSGRLAWITTTISRPGRCSSPSSARRCRSRSSWPCPSSFTRGRRPTTPSPSFARPGRRFVASFTVSPAILPWRVRRSTWASTSRSPGSSPSRAPRQLREVAALLPADRLLIETDAPYLAPVPHRGKRNEPAFVGHVAEKIAALRGVPAAELGAQVARNFEALLMPSLGPTVSHQTA